jgi:hypothetical protein
MVEHRLPKPVVAGSIPVSRSKFSSVFLMRNRRHPLSALLNLIGARRRSGICRDHAHASGIPCQQF